MLKLYSEEQEASFATQITNFEILEGDLRLLYGLADIDVQTMATDLKALLSSLLIF